MDSSLACKASLYLYRSLCNIPNPTVAVREFLSCDPLRPPLFLRSSSSSSLSVCCFSSDESALGAKKVEFLISEPRCEGDLTEAEWEIEGRE
ncbi:hypothetical protein MUK42_05409 [Musa troglodytarum]|uniref:Uncharacterized protein n=1 Tax=Musa troglodytarum TaxID=320322 RepID=A0A9E7JF00_9LILI|nr:hypothetical protein MUK42_05409 [Musa troglodytarum]